MAVARARRPAHDGEMEIFKKPITANVALIAQANLGTGGAHGEVVFRLELAATATRPTMFVEVVKPEVARLLWDMSRA